MKEFFQNLTTIQAFVLLLFVLSCLYLAFLTIKEIPCKNENKTKEDL